MRHLDSIELVQNPAFGAYVLWHFGRAHQIASQNDTVQFHSYFLVLPLILHRPTLQLIKSTMPQSGLPKLAAKIGNQRDDLLAVHQRCLALRGLTLESIGVGLSASIFDLNYRTAVLSCRDIDMPGPQPLTSLHTHSAGKLGRWFAKLPLSAVFSLLQVDP